MSLTAEDHQQILSLASMYSYALDSGDVSAVVDLFTKVGVFEAPSGTYNGKDVLEAYFKKNIENDANEKHFVSNNLISGDGEQAFHTCYYQVILVGNNSLKATGVYEDHLEKVDGVWKFEQRKVVPDWSKS